MSLYRNALRSVEWTEKDLYIFATVLLEANVETFNVNLWHCHVNIFQMKLIHGKMLVDEVKISHTLTWIKCASVSFMCINHMPLDENSSNCFFNLTSKYSPFLSKPHERSLYLTLSKIFINYECVSIIWTNDLKYFNLEPSFKLRCCRAQDSLWITNRNKHRYVER